MADIPPKVPNLLGWLFMKGMAQIEEPETSTDGQNRIFAQMYGSPEETGESEPEPELKPSRSANSYLQSLKDLNDA